MSNRAGTQGRDTYRCGSREPCGGGWSQSRQRGKHVGHRRGPTRLPTTMFGPHEAAAAEQPAAGSTAQQRWRQAPTPLVRHADLTRALALHARSPVACCRPASAAVDGDWGQARAGVRYASCVVSAASQFTVMLLFCAHQEG